MFKSNSKLSTTVLIALTVFLLSAIGYITYIVVSGNGQQAKTSPQQSKAANITYSKTIALNMVSPTPEESTLTPTPTEIILANASQTITPGVGFAETPSVTMTETPTTTPGDTVTATPKVSNLPEAGTISQSLMFIGAASLLVLFSFIF